MNKDTRYPYTYACDLIRTYAGCNKDGSILSRSKASQIRGLFASVLGMSDEDLAKKLADYSLANDKALTDKALKDMEIAGLL